jgi:hypothetical protein
MLKRKVLKAFSVLTLALVVAAIIPAGVGTVHAATNTVFDVKGGLYTPVLIHNGMTDVASVGAYAQAKGASAAINGTYFDAYATEAQVTAKGGDVSVLRTFGAVYGAPLNFPSGVLIENGRLLHGSGYGSGPGEWGGYLGGVTKQGGFIVEQVSLSIGFIVDGNRSTVWRVNHPSYETTSVVLYDDGFGRDVQLKPGDKAVIVEGGIIKDIASYGPVKTPAGGFIVVASSSASVFYGNKTIDGFSIGQQASWTWEVASPSGYNFKDVYLAVGSDVAKINGAGGTNRPYIGGTADGKISIGVGNAAECVNALFLDGGGSIAYYKDGKYLNGPGRNVSNAIGFVPTGQSGNSAAPATPPASAALTAIPTSSTVFVDSKSFERTIDVDGSVYVDRSKNFDFTAYNIGGNNYFKLRDLAFALSGTEKQFEVGWDGAANAITLTSGAAYTPAGGEMAGEGVGNKSAATTSAKIYLDGALVSLTAYNIDNNNYFKLRDVGQALNFDVSWDDTKNAIFIDATKGYTPD